jgi:hypothetical protein
MESAGLASGEPPEGEGVHPSQNATLSNPRRRVDHAIAAALPSGETHWSRFIDVLSNIVNRKLIDKTGLTGMFRIQSSSLPFRHACSPRSAGDAGPTAEQCRIRFQRRLQHGDRLDVFN